MTQRVRVPCLRYPISGPRHCGTSSQPAMQYGGAGWARHIAA